MSFFDGLGSVLGSMIGDILGQSLNEKMEMLENVRARRRAAAAGESAPEDGAPATEDEPENG
jgi:ABC-type xylose transport system permease subunit